MSENMTEQLIEKIGTMEKKHEKEKHQKEKNHSVRVSEFWITSRR